MAEVPQTRYTRLGEDRIAYQVVGEGPVDLLFTPASSDCIDIRWDWPPYASFLRRLASFSRLIMFDRRGYGASDSVSGATLPEYERWADDARAVLDASGSEQAAIYGASDSGPIAILFAAVEPERTQALILGNATARFVIEDDYPSGLTKADIDGAVQVLEEIWGTDAFGQFGFPDASRDPAFGQWFAKMSRLACTPRRASSYFRWVQSTDVRKVLPSIRVPTLILHRKEVSYVTLNQGRYLAEHIPGARLVVLPGADIGLFTEPTAQGLRAVEEFLKTLPSTTPDRALAAVLLTEGTQTVFAGHRCHPGFLAAG